MFTKLAQRLLQNIKLFFCSCFEEAFNLGVFDSFDCRIDLFKRIWIVIFVTLSFVLRWLCSLLVLSILLLLAPIHENCIIFAELILWSSSIEKIRSYVVELRWYNWRFHFSPLLSLTRWHIFRSVLGFGLEWVDRWITVRYFKLTKNHQWGFEFLLTGFW